MKMAHHAKVQTGLFLSALSADSKGGIPQWLKGAGPAAQLWRNFSREAVFKS
jgi:hypothetical protein